LDNSNTSTIKPINKGKEKSTIGSNTEIDELSKDHYNITTRSSKRLATKEPTKKGLFSPNLYRLASLAFLESYNKGVNSDFNDNNLSLNTTPNIEEDSTNTSKIIVYKKDLKFPIILKDPKSYKEAHSSLYKDYWILAEQKELNSLKSNNTWNLIAKKDINSSPINSIIKPLKTR